MTTSGRVPDVTIVGGGVIGCALAWELSRRNVSVEILERREIGREASWASAGIISPPGPRFGSRSDLALQAFDRYPGLIAEVEEVAGYSVGYVRTGAVDLGTDGSAPAMRDVLAWQSAHGIASEWLDETGIRRREPAAHHRFTAGVFVPGAGSVILGRMTAGLARAAESRGAIVREHTVVAGIELHGGRASGLRTFDGVRPVGTVVIAAGAWSRSLGESVDLHIPTTPVRGQMIAIADPPVSIHAVLSGLGGYVVPRADGTMAVGATEEAAAGFEVRVTPSGIAEMVALVESLAPSLAKGRFVEAWAGLRPGSDDGELIVGRAPHIENLWVATGHFRSGALLAPATAELLATSIVSGKADPRLSAFDPGRFMR